jgi:putative inorganic carbon (hco3(-)) transporter
LRDIVLGPLIAWIAAYGFFHPWVGIIGWTWISLMNPHAYSWRLSSMPVAAAIAGGILVGLVTTRDRRNFFVTRETVVLLLFMLWMSITLALAFYTSESYSMWNRVMKIDLMLLVAMVVLYTKRHIMLLAWVVAASVGFYGVKGGLFTVATGGSYRVWGPMGSFIEGNNEVALALVIVIPIMRFLQLVNPNVWVKRGLTVAMLLCVAAALGSQSRGALLAIAAMAAVMWWRSEKKFITGIAVVVVAIAILAFLPETWWARMSTIGQYKDDGSAMGRINAWWMAWNLAKANFFGGGFSIYKPDLFALYAPDPTDIHAAHSIYFMVLGEHGFIGLFLFLLMWIFVWSSAGWLRKQGKKAKETDWLSHLGAMCQVSLAGYAVGGTFLSLSYYDLPYNVLVLVVLGRRWIEGKEWLKETDEPLLRLPSFGKSKTKKFAR